MPTYYHPFRFLKNAEEARPPVDWEEVEGRILDQYRYYGKNILKFDETRLSKQQVMALINDAELNEKHHRKLLLMDALLAFLENGQLDFFKKNKEWVAFTDDQFVEWLRPYFTSRYNQLLKKAIDQQTMKTDHSFTWVLDSGFNLPPSYYDAAYKGVNELILAKAIQLNKVAYDNNYLMRPFQLLTIDSRRVNSCFRANYGYLFSKLPVDKLPAITAYGKAIKKISNGILQAIDHDILQVNSAQLDLVESIIDCTQIICSAYDKNEYYQLKAGFHEARKLERPEEKEKMEAYFEELSQNQRKEYFNLGLTIILLMIITFLIVFYYMGV